uniref:Ribosomal protein S6 kinase polypeptide 1 n=1 Tax=Tetraodon nigroviridis TaxID=99883 RepID=H3DG30_TETNG
MISQRDKGDLARFYTVTDPKKHHKGYTVYKVTARLISRRNPEDVQEITVWKRYSDFRKLHQNLWQLHKALCSQSELFPPFARAKVFGRFDDSVIEERRQCSEDLLQFSANIPALYNSQHIQEFFKGGEIHDGSELIGPAEPHADFLADSVSDCSSDGPPSGGDLTSQAVETDSLAGLDDGMASGRTSPNHPQGEATIPSNSPRLPSLHSPCSPSPAPVSSTPKPEVRPGRSLLFPGSLKKVGAGASKDVKSDYLDRASELISLAVQKEKEQDFHAAFSCYRNGVDLLLQGVQGEPSPKRREAVKKKTAEYLMRAEQIASQHLRSSMGQGSTQTVVIEISSSQSLRSPSEELRAYRVLGIIDKVLLVMDKMTQETFILKGLRKSSDCGRIKRTIVPHSVPHMVQLRKFIVSEDAVFLLLQYAEGGKLWSHIGKYLRSSSQEGSFDIPFIQKSHTAAIRSPQQAFPPLGADSISSGSAPVACPDPASELQKQESCSPSLQKTAPLARPDEESDSGAMSEEEFTNSYLALCNEYEQEKVNADVLEEQEERSEKEVLSLEVPMGTATTSSRSRSLLSNDSLSSPISSQELGFFPESSKCPLPSPAVPLTLDQSKHTPMEFFRIDSKDSTGEVNFLDLGEQHISQKSVPIFSTSDLGSDVTEGPPELAQEVGLHSGGLWGLDCSDKGSNDSVPVISFKEAAVEDEGHPPDLLVNLPVPSGAVHSSQEELDTSGVIPGLEAEASPQKFTQPDVLQLLIQPEEEQELPSLHTASATCDTSAASSSISSMLEDCSVALGQEKTYQILTCDAARQDVDLPLTDPFNEQHENGTNVNASPGSHPGGGSRSFSRSTSEAEAHAAQQSSPGLHDEPPRAVCGPRGSEFDKEVSRLFAQLDELSLAASQARIPEELVKCWAAEMTTALDSLHQEGIVCRDLNPNNILLDHQGHVQLTYFCSWVDVAESCDREAVSNMYCAPEVGGISEETAACDWWSLGAILFELLTGTSLLRCHPAGIGRHTTLNIPEFVSEEARSLLEQLLQFNPVERLGAGGAGVDEIKSHPFFVNMDWPNALR